MENSTSNVFGSLLKDLRERRNLTQTALSYKIGKKSRGDIQAWESGRHLPKEREMVLALARALSPLTPGEVDRLLLAAHHVPEYQTLEPLARESPAVQQLRGPFMVEDLPSDFVSRPHEFDRLVEMLLDNKRQGLVAITAALRGAGGYGKTTIARALCHDPRFRETFSDGILWVTLGENPGNLVGKIEDLISALGKEHPGFTGVDAAAAHLAMLLADRTMLIVVDDVWNPAHLHPFLQGGRHCTRLITTRDDSVLPLQTQRIQVDAMRRDEAFLLLVSGLSGVPRSLRDTQSLRTLVQKLGEWPLLLKLVNAALRERVREYHQPLSEALIYVNTALKKRGLTAFDHNKPQQRDQAVRATLSVSFELLGEDSSRYRKLAIFPEDVSIPLVTVQKLWSAADGRELDDFDIDAICGHLRRLSLLLDFDPVKRSIRLHDVIRAYLQQELSESVVATLHGQFLDAYRTRRWVELPDSEPYLWDHLANHLVSAARGRDLVTTAQDLYYLAKKIYVRDTYAAVLDLLSAEGQAPEVASLRLLKHNVTNMSHLLNACQAFDEVAVTLHSRLAHLEELAEQCQALQQRLSRPFLIPWHTLPSLPNPALMRTLQGHTRTVHGCAISPAGDWVVSASWDGTLKVWNARTGAEYLTLEGHTASVHGCAVSPLGDYIVSASGDRTLKIWDAQIGTELLTLRGHTDDVYGCAVSPDGNWIVSASQDETLRIWDAQTGAERLVLRGHTGLVHACAVSPKGDWIVSASWDGTLKIWDAYTGTEQLTLLGHGGSVYACAVSPKGDWIVSASWDRTLKIWDVRTGAERSTLRGHTEIVLGCAVSPAGDYLVSAGQDETLKVWDVQTGNQLLTLEGHSGPIDTCAVSPKGDYVLSGSSDKQLKMWDIHAESRRSVSYWHKVNGCAVSPDGKWVISAQEDEKLKVWDARTGAELLTLEGHSGPVYACAVSPRGDWIVSAGDDNTLSVWDARTGEELGRLEGHEERVCACAVSPAGDWIVSASDDKTLRVWDRETGYHWLDLRGHEDVVNGCAISPAGDYIVSASGDKTLKIWDARTGTERFTLTGHTGWVNGCAISPAGDYIVSASGDKTLKIWDVQTGSEIRTLQGHEDAVRGCAFSPAGDRIVSVAENGTLKVWDAFEGRCLTTLATEGNLRTCTFCPDGVHLIAGGYSGLYFLQLVL
jgi:WD40 repeat protein